MDTTGDPEGPEITTAAKLAIEDCDFLGLSSCLRRQPRILKDLKLRFLIDLRWHSGWTPVQKWATVLDIPADQAAQMLVLLLEDIIPTIINISAVIKDSVRYDYFGALVSRIPQTGRVWSLITTPPHPDSLYSIAVENCAYRSARGIIGVFSFAAPQWKPTGPTPDQFTPEPRAPRTLDSLNKSCVRNLVRRMPIECSAVAPDCLVRSSLMGAAGALATVLDDVDTPCVVGRYATASCVEAIAAAICSDPDKVVAACTDDLVCQLPDLLQQALHRLSVAPLQAALWEDEAFQRFDECFWDEGVFIPDTHHKLAVARCPKMEHRDVYDLHSLLTCISSDTGQMELDWTACVELHELARSTRAPEVAILIPQSSEEWCDRRCDLQRDLARMRNRKFVSVRGRLGGQLPTPFARGSTPGDTRCRVTRAADLYGCSHLYGAVGHDTVHMSHIADSMGWVKVDLGSLLANVSYRTLKRHLERREPSVSGSEDSSYSQDSQDSQDPEDLQDSQDSHDPQAPDKSRLKTH